MKLHVFRTSDINIVELCRDMFHVELPSATLAKRSLQRNLWENAI